MSIHNLVEKSMSGGMQKGIEASAINMMLDNLQKSQYQFPIKSTVRELVSNGIDSIAEREMAKEILSGNKQVSDYFVEKEGEEYQDSKFDPTYYDLNWLSDDNTIGLTYIVGSDLERDKVVITDNGVGLGSYRIQKYFSLGYSTKRLSKLPLGKFGIGGKAALSIGVDYFTMESRYNGRLYRFNIYSHTVDSIVPAFNLDTGQTHESEIFNEGTEHEYQVFYESTEEKNGVTITIDAKKNHKQQYIDAVKSQLLYFPNIEFNIREKGFYSEKIIDTPIKYQADILYEDDYIVLSNNSYWSKPHLLLNKINYGYINWEELELDPKEGNIGIKIAPEDVSVNPSRESIIWDDETKKMVLDRFKTVADIASLIIQEQLKESDYLQWIRDCYATTGKAVSDRSVVGRLSKIVDISEIKPSFLPEPRLKFQITKIFNGLFVRSVKIVKKQVANMIRYEIKRWETRSMADVIQLPVFLVRAGERASNRKDKWLFSQYINGFILVTQPITTLEGMLHTGMTEESAASLLALFNKEGETFAENVNIAWDYLTKSRDIIWYDSVEVPEDFKGSDEEADEEDVIKDIINKHSKQIDKENNKERQAQLKAAQLSRLERRKLEGKTLIYTPRARTINNSTKPEEDGTTKVYQWQKIEIPIKDMNEWQAQEIYYGVGPGTDELLHFVAMISRDPDYNNGLGSPVRGNNWVDKHKDEIQKYVTLEEGDNCQHFFGNNEIMLVKASIANAKYMRDFVPIHQFFQVVRNKTVTMSNLLIRWNTARIIKDKLAQAAFLFNFQSFNPIYTSYYKQLSDYVELNYREVEGYRNNNYFGLDQGTYTDLISHLDKVKQFQDFVATQPTEKEVADMAQFMFGNKEIQDGQAVDPQQMVLLSRVIEYSNAVGVMFNHMPALTGCEFSELYNKGVSKIKKYISITLEMEIKQYLEMKGLTEYGQDEEEFKQFQEDLDNSGAPLVEDNYVVEHDPYSTELQTSHVEVAVYNHSNDVVKVLTPGLDNKKDLEIPPSQAIMQEF